MSNYEICQEMGQNFIDYAYAVNTDRSIPSAADGLKPVHRRILWSMYKEKNTSDKAHVKCARIVGDVIGKYHPHGDTSVYDAMTRLAQEWNVRYPFIDWHGNKGNIGGDGAAAMRYTEARLNSLVQEGMLQNLDKKVVDMQPNYSEDLEEPVWLPSLFPNLLCNPNTGIGVAMACNWLPYNFKELVKKVIIPDLRGETVDYESIAPDFPTGGNICNPQAIKDINATGRGSIIVEGKWYQDERNGHTLIVFYEIPYGAKIEYEEQGKAKGIIPQLRKAIQEEKITDVIDVRDESSKQIKIVIECAADADIDKIILQIFNETDLRKSFSANYVALVGKTPRLLTLFNAISIYKAVNLECIRREFQFKYDKTKDRIEILEGLIWAVQNIDDVVYNIRHGESLRTENGNLTDRQIKAILDMKLGRLSKLEEEKLQKELEEKQKYLIYCELLINDGAARKELLIERVGYLADKFGDDRRTTTIPKEIVKTVNKKSGSARTIIPEDVFVSLTNTGYLKSVPAKSYKQNLMDLKVFKAQTTDIILLFSSFGKVYRLKINEIKQCTSKDKGIACGALVNLEPNEKILNIFSMNTDERYPYIVGFTRLGLIKKSNKSIFVGTTQNKNGLKAATLNTQDEYVAWYESNGDYAIILTNNNYIIKFNLEDVNAVGKTARGVKAITLTENDYVLDTLVIAPTVDRFNILRYNLHNKDIVLQKRGGRGKCLAAK